MTTNSLDEMYKWLAVEPRTRGWNAILAYDRTKTNTVLLQEYISRFGTNDYLEPITELLEDNQVPTQRDYVVDYVLDAPRLSFVNSSLENSMAHSCQKIMGGTRLTFERPLGATEWKVIKVANWKPVNGPTLEYDIELKATQGTVDKLGTVSLNIAEGRNYRMTYEDTEHLAKFVGERFKARFARLPEPQKTFVLNEITIDKDQLLKPKNFVIRTHNKAGSGATLAANETKEEGAVLLFVTTEGENDGALPALNRDLRYLLPDGISATLLLGHNFFYEHTVVVGMKRVLKEDTFKYELEMRGDGKAIIAAYAISGGRTLVRPFNLVVGGYTYTIQNLGFSIEGRDQNNYFKGSHVRGGDNSSFLSVNWNKVRQPISIRATGPGGAKTLSAFVDIDMRLFLSFNVDLETGELLMTYPEESEWIKFHIDIDMMDFPPNHLSDIVRAMSVWLREFFYEANKDYTQVMGSLNVLVLHSLLFRGKNQIQLQKVNFDYDLAVFGQVGPTLTALTLNELEPVVGRGDTFQFNTVPAINNVIWSVENISGDTGATGTIDQKGKYTAPNAGEFPGDYTRVRVKATAGGNSSSALVSVLRYDISINPLVQIVGAGDSGGAGGGAVGWRATDCGEARPQTRPWLTA